MKKTWNKTALVALSLWLITGSGCTPDQSLRSPEVRAVTHYGRTLNEDATPQEVAYVALRAMRDDFLARSRDEREEALDVQFDCAAADMLRKLNPFSISDDEYLNRVVRHWTPVVGHYVANFDFSWEDARMRLVPGITPELKVGKSSYVTTNVLMELQDPTGDPQAQVVLRVRLAQDNNLWRVYKLEYDRSTRSIPKG